MNKITLVERMEATGSRSSGFNYLRIILAVSIVAWHSIQTSYGEGAVYTALLSPARPFIAALLPMFFALSGFLVAGSLQRSAGLASFMGLRFLRIFPALLVETLLSAIILGLITTKDSLRSYFSNPDFLRYLLNMIGDIHYHLPGVFQDNPLPQIVNVQLWTVAYELECYIVLGILALFGITLHTYRLLGCVVLFQIIVVIYEIYQGHFHDTPMIVQGPVLVATFLAGVALFNLRHAIIYSPWLFAFALCALIGALRFRQGDYCIAFPAAYVTIYIGLLDPPARFLRKVGDLSYGIFLYGFPIQQFITTWGQWTHRWYINLAFALPVIGAIASASWNIIEKPTLSLKKHLNFLGPIDTFIRKAATLVQNLVVRSHTRAGNGVY